MKAPIFLAFLITIVACSPIKNADRMAKKNETTILYPQVVFNVESAKAQLNEGTSTIRGVLYKSTNKLSVVGSKSFGANVKVCLFPVNNYFNAWYDLRKKKENKRTVVYMSDEAFSMRLETTTDDYGRFEFKNMKPGKYFLQAFMSTSQFYTRDKVVGSNSYGTQYYQKERYSVTKNHRNEEFVEVKEEGEMVEVKLN